MKRVASAGLLSGSMVVFLLLLSGCGSSVSAPIAVGLAPGSTQSIDQAQTVPITATVKQDPKTAGVTWAVSGGGTLANATTSSATYNAPASVTTGFTATVTATSVSDTTKIATLQIKVAPLPAITTTSFVATAGTAYNGTLSESGGTSPYTFTITSGSLPVGLTLNGSTGAITGTPTGPAGNSSVTFQITDAAKMSASHAVAITVNAPPALTITTASLPAGTTGAAYSQTLQASGGIPPYTWAVTTGSLPAGLSLNSGTGAISGTPSGTLTGTTNFTVTATDSQTPTHATSSANLSITVSAPPLSVTTTSLAGGTIGNAYANQTLQATGGISPYKWSVTTGSLPAGLSLNALTGVISGTPTGTFVGTVNFTVTAADSETPSAKTASANLSIAISVAPLSVSSTSSSLAVGVVSSVYAGATLRAAGGITPYSWAVTTGSLPAGLTLSAAGVISGTPTASGTANFTVTVTDSETPTAKTAAANLSIVVNPDLSVTTASLPAGVIGSNYSQTLAAAGGITPYTWSITTGSLPTGLSLNGSTGVISGKPSGTFTGTVSFTVTVTDNESPTKQTASANLSIIISAPPLSVTTSSLVGGSIGNAYSQTLQATGGVTPYSWTVTTGSLPAGLSLNAATGVISGTPTGTFVGTDSFTVTVTDAETPTGGKASVNLSIAISVAPLSVTTTSSSLPLGVANSLYAGATLQATGGITPYSWAVTTGSLPAGLTLNASTGAISGTPTAPGTANFTVTVTDSETPTAKTATANLSLVVNPALSVTTTTLPPGVIGTVYPGATLAAAGGITPYTWSVTTGSLPAGLSLNSSTGVISGTPTGTFTGTTSFTVTATDNESPTKHSASANLSITVTAPTLKVTTTSLPNGVINNSYSATVNATGGVQPYIWSLSGNPAWLSINSSTGALSGTPTATGSFNFKVTATDSETPTPQTASANLSIVVNNSAPLQITTTGLPQDVAGTPYSNTAYLAAAGGVQPYTWSYTGSLPPGMTLNTSTGQLTGTPTSIGTFNFTAKVTDSSSPTQSATANLSISINSTLTITTTSVPDGSVGNQYNANVNAAGGVQPYSWSITSGSLPPGLNFNNNNTLNISGQPTTTGTYTFTLQVTDSENTPVSVSNNYTIVIGTQPPGYTVSGNVGYSGSKTGRIYLQLTGNNNNCCGNNLGTSISEAVLTSGGAFTIHGVQPGTYTLQAFMDNLGYGAENASNPTGSVSNITVANSVTGVSIVLTDPGTVTLSSAPSWSGNNGNGAFNGGAIVSFQPITNSNGIEMPASYTVQWSTTSSFTSIVGSKNFPATGGNNPWIVNGLTNGQTLYFRARGVAGTTSNWSGPSNAITIGAPTGGNTVSGTVTFSETATGPLYVGFYNQSTGAVYVDVVGSQSSPPHSPAAYTVQVPSGSNYFFVGILDQTNSGLISGPGQVSNTNHSNNQAPVSVTGNMTNENLTLPSGNSIATVTTQSWNQINTSGTNAYYNIGFNINGVVKLPVAVELATGPTPGVVIPADIASGGFYGNSDQFTYWANLNGATPQVGDIYTLNVTYSDGTSEVLTVTVGAVLSAFATNLSPQGSGIGTTPNFSWTDPANASSYTYQFQLWDQNGNQIWQIPGNNSNSNGFSSSITSITWGVDPTGTGDLPSVSSLNASSNYNWQITVKDANGNSAGEQVTFQTAAAPLTLPAPGSVGSTVVGQSWGGAINASGGVGPNYTFTVNGTPVPTNGTQVSIGDNLFAWNSGGNTLSLGGTPTAIQTVSLTVSVTDSASDTAGPDTYTINVTAAAPLAIQSTTLPGGDKGWLYNTSLQANGGVQPYTWSITSGTPPGGLSINNSNGNGNIAGTPTAAGTSNFTIMVTDSASETASASVSIVIGDCANNANLHGNYAFMVNGWKSSTDAQSTVGSFVADGAGNISSGSIDIGDQIKGPQTATITGTYCVSSSNLVGISLAAGGGASGTALFEGVLDSTGNGHIIRYDNSSTEVSAGLLRKQTTTAFSTSKISGNYAFGFVGANQSSNRFGLAGEFNSNGSGTLTGSGDYDSSCSGGSCSGNVGTTNLTASDFSVVSSTTGRGTVSIFVSAPAVTVNFVFYVVSSSEVLMMAADNTESPSLIMAGQVLQQSGTLTDASLNGISVIELQGVGGGGSSPQATAGFITTNGAGTFSISADQNQGGTMGTLCGSGTYSVASNGRMTLTSFTQCGGGGSGGNTPVFYLVAENQAFVVGTDNSVTSGIMTPQVGSGFTVASLSGNYLGGSEQTDNVNGKAQVIAIHADGAGNLTGTSDENDGPNGCGGSCAGTESSTIVATYALYPGGPDGKFAINQDGVTQVYLYMISPTQAVILPVSSSQNQSSNPSLADFHQ